MNSSSRVSDEYQLKSPDEESTSEYELQLRCYGSWATRWAPAVAIRQHSNRQWQALHDTSDITRGCVCSILFRLLAHCAERPFLKRQIHFVMGDEGKDKVPHVALVPYPAQGHLPPMIQLSRKLAAQGFQVTVLNLEAIHKTISSKHWKNGLGFRLEQLPSALDMPFGVDASTYHKNDGWVEHMKQIEGQFAEALNRLSPSCVIADYFLPWGIKVPKRLGIPAVTYFPGNVTWALIHHHVDLLVANGDADSYGEDSNQTGKIIRYLPGIDALKSEDIPHYLLDKDKRAAVDAQCMAESDGVLVNTMEELEQPKALKAMREVLGNKRFAPVAPLFDLINPGASLRDEDATCLEWLDTKAPRSVLYISFGSIGVLSEERFQQLADGLVASGKPFLWVIRQDLVEGMSEEVLEEFKQRTDGQGKVVQWAPQLRVLAHPSVGGFLSHCGWNSVMESLCNGVPILAWPCFGDQPLNCTMLVETLKLGTRFVVHEAEKVIADFMTSDIVELRIRAEEFKSVARDTASEGGISAKNLKNFMDEMTELDPFKTNAS